MASKDITKFVDGNGDEFNFRDPSKATTSLENVTSSAINNLYSATDGRAGHSNIAVGYGLLATIDTTNLTGYSDIHAVFEIYDLAANSNYSGKRVVVANIRNSSATAGAGSYVYKINQLIYEPISTYISIKAFRTNYDDVRLYSVGMGSGMYGGVVCKLVSCTGYAGHATYGKVTLSKSTASSSVPSGTEISISTETNPSGNSLVRDYRSIPEDVSKGANLVVNGSGRMSSGYNFSSFLYIPSISNNGSAGSFGFSSSARCDEFISCDFTKRILFTADVKNLVAQTSCTHRIFVAEYDIDKKEVTAPNVMFGVGTLTTLAEALNPGDTTVHLTDASNSNWLATASHQRGLIFWNYENSLGYLYPPETYSRNVYPSSDSSSLWAEGGVNQSTGIITLSSAWSGPSYPAGTKVSRRGSGGYHPYPASGSINDTEWHTISGYMSGITAQGTSERGMKFSQGTAFIKVGMLPTNLNNTDTTTGKRAVFTNLYVYEMPDSVSGIVPISNGGTGATTAIGAEYNILNQVADVDTTVNGDRKIALCNQTKSASNGVFRWIKLSNIWTWIKSQLTAVSGVNISGSSASCTGNAATATAFSSGTAKTKFDGIAEGATKVEASTTNGKVKINGTDTTVYTHPSQTAYTSKGTATKVPQITTDATGHVTGITEVTISGVTPASHTHGNIQNGGALQTNDITIASGDKLVVTDSSDSDKVARASVSFDGSTTTKALTQKGTFETFLTSHQDISGKMATDCSNKASGALQNLTSQLTTGTDPFTDGTEIFSSYAADTGFDTTDHVNQPYRRKASAMWSYIKTKLGISSGKGGSDTPVYFNSDGQATTCNEMLRKNGGNATDTCMNALLMALPTNWTAPPTDDTYLVRRDTGGAQSFGQVKFSTVWSYIYNKLFYAKNPADSSQTTHKRIQLGYAAVGGSNVGFCCYLVHIFFNYVDGNLKGCGVTALVTLDWRTSESRLAKLCIVNDNGMSAAGYNIVLANFLTDSGANLHITIGLVKKSASTTLVAFSYSYCRIVPISNGMNWTHSVASDTVGTYDFLIQGTYENAGNADSVDGYHIQVGSYSSRTDTISLY